MCEYDIPTPHLEVVRELARALAPAVHFAHRDARLSVPTADLILDDTELAYGSQIAVPTLVFVRFGLKFHGISLEFQQKLDRIERLNFTTGSLTFQI